MSNEKRIYVVVAETVQNPLRVAPDSLYRLEPTSDTMTIVQPIGRIGAQIGHVVSKMRLLRVVKSPQALRRRDPNQPITTIILSVPDSFQLHFRTRLLAGIMPYCTFCDENQAAYGFGKIHTATCTYPVTREELKGVLDYLPLWGSGGSK